jgi:SprT protein
LVFVKKREIRGMALSKEELEKRLEKYIPAAATPYVSEFIMLHRVHLHVKRTRATCLGDYRPPQEGKPHRISVNNDLNSFAFLVTLTHEMAHLKAWLQYKDRIKPHGLEWKAIYREEMYRWLRMDIFPEELAQKLIQHLDNPKASTCADADLYRLLRTYNNTPPPTVLNDLEEGEWFVIQGGRVFQKGKLRRTRYVCLNYHSKRHYLISGEAEVARAGLPPEEGL